MKKAILLFASILFLTSCHNTFKRGAGRNTSHVSDSSHLSGDLIKPDFIKKQYMANHTRLACSVGTIESFKKYLKTLDTFNLASIPEALDYIRTCIPATDSLTGDSAISYFRELFLCIVNKLSDGTVTEYHSIIANIDSGGRATPDVIAFQNNLDECGIGVFTSEGTDYLDEEANYFYNNFKDRGTKDIRNFLHIRSLELKQGYSEDAGLLISFNDLAGRVKNWEKFNTSYPNSMWSEAGKFYYETYLETLLTGMDNSRVFDGDSNILNPEVKKLYLNIIKDTTQNNTSKIIASYYAMLARQDFEENDDSINIFLKKYNLVTMIGVQPLLR